MIGVTSRTCRLWFVGWKETKGKDAPHRGSPPAESIPILEELTNTPLRHRVGLGNRDSAKDQEKKRRVNRGAVRLGK